MYLSPLYAAAQAVEGVASVQITTFQRQGSRRSDSRWRDGRLTLGRLEIARLDNDPNFPERGVFRLQLGGRQMSESAIRPRQLADCGCCAGLAVETPVERRQPAGPDRDRLSRRHARAVQADACSRACRRGRPALAGLRTRDDDDFSIALLDAWATVADVLTFYQERIANESYLRTATERRSLRRAGAADRLRAAARRRRQHLSGLHRRGFARRHPDAAGKPARRSRSACACRASRRPGETAADLRDGREDRGAARVERHAAASDRSSQ